MKFLNDEYTLTIDALGYKPQAEAVRHLALNCETPYAIAISGRWGSGKTSLMKYIMASMGGKPQSDRLKFQDKELKDQSETDIFKDIAKKYESHTDKKEGIQCIWFNPWEQENHSEPFVGLLKEIKKHFSNLLPSIGKEAHLAIQAGLDMLGTFLKLGKKPASNIMDMGEKYEYDHFDYSTRDQRLKLVLQESIDKFLEVKKKGTPKNARLVIFVDDLDRCEEEVIGKLLKEIKQYLSLKRCVFIFGYDRHHVERSLSGCNGRMPRETRAYVEKLFQTTIYIKQPTATKVSEFISDNFDNMKQFHFIKSEDRTDFATFLTEILDPNPRRIKMFLTTFYFHVFCNRLSGDKATDPKNNTITLEELKRLALIAYLKLFYEPVYSVLENDPGLIKDLVAVVATRAPRQSTNYNQGFFHLELLSHIRSESDFTLGETDFARAEQTVKDHIQPLFTDSTAENKFLNEVYQMQGRHKSFGAFCESVDKYFREDGNVMDGETFGKYL